MSNASGIGPTPPGLFALTAPATPGSAAISAASRPSQPSLPPSKIEVGVYVAGANNLGYIERPIPELVSVSKGDPSIAFTVEDTGPNLGVGPGMRTVMFELSNGSLMHVVASEPVDMSGRAAMANFVTRTLDDAYLHHARETWLVLADHGAGDAGGSFTQEPDGSLQHMSVDTLAGAIADGVAIHAQHYPADANRRIDGVVMHECFEGTLTVAETLSRVGVRYFAASAETTIAPGIPFSLLHEIAAHAGDPRAQAQGVVKTVMDRTYLQSDGHGDTQPYHPAATFFVMDLANSRMLPVEQAQVQLNRRLIQDSRQIPGFRARVLSDISQVQGMERDQPNSGVPWNADRPAIAVYTVLARDPRLPLDVRRDAASLALAISGTLLAHGESVGFAGFGPSYLDAPGPTVHLPTKLSDVAPYAPAISELEATQSYLSGNNQLIGALLVPGYAGMAA